MAQGISRKQLKQDDIAEAALDLGHWFERHAPTLLKAAAVLAALALTMYGWFWWRQRSVREAERLLAEGQRLYQSAAADPFTSSEELPTALERFEQAADRAGRAPTGLVARYYRAASLYRLGNYEEAAAGLEQLLPQAELAPTLAASAQLLLSSCYVEAGQGERAVALLRSAAETEGAPLGADLALLHLARVHENLGQADEARAAWRRILERFPESAAAGQARQALER
jgi:TolA-binding protein